MSTPVSAGATIYALPDDFLTSPTNPSAPKEYNAVWREGWGNDELPRFDMKIPQPKDFEPAIIGAFYYTTRPGNASATIDWTLWGDAYNAPISDKDAWRLYIDIPSEVANAQPGSLFNRWYEAPFAPWVPAVAPDRPYEGPFETFVHFYAKDTTMAAAAVFDYGVDVTPPAKVESLTAIPGWGVMSPTGWLTQSRILLTWQDKVYDRMAGTGYFEAFIDGKPYPAVSGAEGASRRVYDLKEHYPGYGVSLPTKREMAIEDLPAGIHTLQVRAVDRATNAGPLSDAVTIQVDPDIPTVGITTPEVDGEVMGARPTIVANATDQAGIQQVVFKFARESSPGVIFQTTTDTVAPYTASTDLTGAGFPDGSAYIVTAETMDMAGRTNFVSKGFRIDKKPTAQVVAPLTGAVSPRLVALKAKASDKTGVTAVEFRIDGGLVRSFAPSAGTTSTILTSLSYLTAGTHTFRTTVTNVSGVSASDQTTFTVDAAVRSTDLQPYATEVDGTTEKSYYRVPWTNKTNLEFNSIVGKVTGASELLYLVDRSPSGTIDPTTPNLYSSSPVIDVRTDPATGDTLYAGTVDLLGAYTSDMVGLAGAAQMPGAVSSPLEGLWYTHSRVRNALSEAGPLVHSVYGVDVTKPTTVTGLGAFSDSTTSTPATNWLDQSRIHLRWDGSQYDALSGVRYYNVYVDGKLPGGESARVPYEQGRARMSATIENLTPGLHKIQVSAVDDASNESTLSAPVTVRMKSTPKIQITSPASEEATLATPAPLRAVVEDPAGLANVVFSIDGTPVQTFLPPSAETTTLVCSMYSPLLSGRYTLTVTANSASGTSVSTSRAFWVDSSIVPVIDPGGGGEGEPSAPAFIWYNSLFPTFSATPSEEPTDPTELLYLVDRTPNTPIDPMNPNSYYATFDVTDAKTHVNGLIDQYGVYLSNPGIFDGGLLLPGRTTNPAEGVWYVHARFRNTAGETGDDVHSGYGVDITPPVPVQNVRAYASINATTPISGWVPQSRVVLRWDGAERDALSGTQYFRVFVDGEPLTDSVSDIGFQPGRATMSLTIEDLTSGTHDIQVAAVDRAGNQGALSAPARVTVDLENPTAAQYLPGVGTQFTSPLAVYVVGGDDSGVSRVRIRLDGAIISDVVPSTVSTSVPAGTLVPSSQLASGAHTMTVEITDAVGRMSFGVRTFNIVDTLAPRFGDYQPPNPLEISGTSTTNPYKADDAEGFWREGWGNSLYPQFSMTTPSFPGYKATSMYYTVDRSPVNDMSLANRGSYNHSSSTIGTTFNGEIDQLGLVLGNPLLGGGPIYGTKVTDPVEGIWYWHYLFEDINGETSGPYTISYGVDITKPARVTGLGAYASATATQTIVGPVASSRVHLRWNNAQQDKLSGTAYYRVYVDGAVMVPGGTDLTDPLAGDGGVPWYKEGLATASLTLENLGSGQHSIEVAAVDKAGNEGQRSAAVSVLVDRAVPTVSILAPSAAGGLVGAYPTLTAKVTDDVGVSSMTFSVDGVVVASKSFSPASKAATVSVNPTLSGFASGSHTLTVRATDLAGKTITATRMFVLDKTPPVLTYVSAGPNPFYPRKRDGYKDNFIVKLRSSETATARLTIKDSTGRVWRTVNKAVAAGSSSVSWNGKSDANTMKSGTFRWSLQLIDPAGNVSSVKTGSVSLRYYEIVYVGGGARVVQR